MASKRTRKEAAPLKQPPLRDRALAAVQGDAIRIEAREGRATLAASGCPEMPLGDRSSRGEQDQLRGVLSQYLRTALGTVPNAEALRVVRDAIAPRIATAREEARAQREAAELLGQAERAASGIAEFVTGDVPLATPKARGGPCAPQAGGPCVATECGAFWVEHHKRTAGLADDVEAHMKGLALYRRGGELVRVQEGRAEPLDAAATVDAISRRVHLYDIAIGRGGILEPYEVGVGTMLANVVRSRTGGPFPMLRGIAATPILLPDGRVLDTPGYERDSGILLVPSREYGRVPEHPTVDDARAAAERILDLVCDFPFLDGSHRSAWLAEVLTLVVAFAIPGPLPMFAHDSPEAGAGKTLLAQTACAVAFGILASPYDWPTDRDGEEIRKMLFAAARGAERYVLIDNVPEGRLVKSGALEKVLTARSVSGRVLGVSKNETAVPWDATVGLSTINLRIGRAMARRTLPVRIDPECERPEDRDGPKPGTRWRHTLPDAALSRHPELLIDALTIAAAYARAGRPAQNLPAWGSYESWSPAVRDPITWLGLPDPYESRRALRRGADSEGDALAGVLEALETAFPRKKTFVAGDLPDKARGNADLRTALLATGCTRGEGEIDTVRLGHWLSHREGQVRGGRRLAAGESGMQGRVRWVERRGGPGGQGDANDDNHDDDDNCAGVPERLGDVRSVCMPLGDTVRTHVDPRAGTTGGSSSSSLSSCPWPPAEPPVAPDPARTRQDAHGVPGAEVAGCPECGAPTPEEGVAYNGCATCRSVLDAAIGAGGGA